MCSCIFNKNVTTTNLCIVIIISLKVVCENSEGCSAEEIVSLQLSVILYILISIFLFGSCKIREVRIRMMIISRLQKRSDELD